MTLAEARTILEEYSRWRRLPYDSDIEGPDTDKLDEAIDVAISVLPEERHRMTCKEKLDYIVEMVGRDPFKCRSRKREQVVWRYCIIYKLLLDGYGFSEIARAAGYDHATIIFAVKSIKRDLEFREKQAVETWNELLEKVQGSYYGL